MEQRGKWSIGGVTSTREYLGYGYGVGGAKEYAVSRYSRVSIGDGWTPGAALVGGGPNGEDTRDEGEKAS